MSIFLYYLLLFVGSTYPGVVFLSWMQVCFLQGRGSSYLNGLIITLIVTTCLCVIVLLIIYQFAHPVDLLCNRIKKENYTPTKDEEKSILELNKKINKITVISLIIGYLFGNLITMIISIAKGDIPAVPSRIILVIIQSSLAGAAACLYTVFSFDVLIAKIRKSFKIKHIQQEQRSSKISSTLAFIILTSVFYLGINVGMVPYNLIATSNSNNIATPLSYYIGYSIFVMIVTTIYCGIPIYIILKAIRERLQLNSNKIHELAEKGDLSERIDISIVDDFGYLTSTVNEMMDTVSNTINSFKVESTSVSKSADILSSVTTSSSASICQMAASFEKINEESYHQNELIKQVSENITDLRDSANSLQAHMMKQSSDMQENSASITEITGNINSVAEMTKKADELSSTLSETSIRGNDMIQQSVVAIADIQKASKEVQDIVKIIQAIASQTNLLSMNAAIEAAHAGNFGAGFAVVADEVRSLATSSAKSAKDIQNHIKSMALKIEDGVKTISAAGSAFEQISINVNENQQLIKTISNAMEEQKIGANETLKAITEIADGLNLANDFVNKQTINAETVDRAMEEVISSSKEVETVIAEGGIASASLQESIDKITDTVEKNKISVKNMETQINSFKM